MQTQLARTEYHLSGFVLFLYSTHCPVLSTSLKLFFHLIFSLQYLCELALLNGDPYLKYLPSVVAASALCLARHTLQQEAWVRAHTRLYLVFNVHTDLGRNVGEIVSAFSVGSVDLMPQPIIYSLLISYRRGLSSTTQVTLCLISATVCRISIAPSPWHLLTLSKPLESSTTATSKSCPILLHTVAVDLIVYS